MVALRLDLEIEIADEDDIEDCIAVSELF